MRWTPEKIEELRDLAHLGGKPIAKRFNCPSQSVRYIASKHHIHLGPEPPPPNDGAPASRDWWECHLPKMRAALKADIQWIMQT